MAMKIVSIRCSYIWNQAAQIAFFIAAKLPTLLCITDIVVLYLLNAIACPETDPLFITKLLHFFAF